MEFEQFEFAHPSWLLLAAVIPLVFFVFSRLAKRGSVTKQLEPFIDKHLLPHLLVADKKEGILWKHVVIWSIMWGLLTLAMAEPRWNFREVEIYSKDQSLMILLDLSQSMDASDVKPSRLIRAKQKIKDLLKESQGLHVGLIAFAADPHMITPMTDDKETIKRLLPSLDTSLVAVQGSRLSHALEMAGNLLRSEPGNNKAIWLVSDGGFEDGSAISEVKKLADEGIVIHSMGVGTPSGAPVKDQEGNFIKRGGIPVFSKLEEDKLKEIANLGEGVYFSIDNSINGERAILDRLSGKAAAEKNGAKKIRLWEERFYLLVFPAMVCLLLWFRRGFIFAGFLLFLFPVGAEAGVLSDFFKNHEQRGKEAFENGDYKQAGEIFQDPYRKGVASYREGNFAEAEAQFRKPQRGEVARNAGYNLGNALAEQKKLKEAVKAYEEVLKEWPDFQNARENLEIVKEMLEQEEKKNQEGSQEGQNGEDKEKGGENNEKKSSKNEEAQKEESQNRTEQETGKDGKEGEVDPQNTKRDQKDSPQKMTSPQEREENDSQGQEKSHKEENGLEDAPQKGVQEEKLQNESAKDAQSEKNSGEGQEEGSEAFEMSEKDMNADLWLNRLTSDPKQFLKNKFYIESKLKSTKEGVEPW